MHSLDFDLFMDLHNHTIWSDGVNKPEEIILNTITYQVVLDTSTSFDHAFPSK